MCFDIHTIEHLQKYSEYFNPPFRFNTIMGFGTSLFESQQFINVVHLCFWHFRKLNLLGK